MALTGQAKADYQRQYMRGYRALGRDPRGKTLVRPSPISGKTLLDPSVRPSKTQIPGLIMRGNTIVGVSNPAPVQQPQRYIPGKRYQPGERVLVQQGRRMVEAVMPELDADGQPMPS